MAEPAPAPVSVADLKLASAVLGGKWKPAILACLAGGPRRFGALRRAVGGVSEKVLIQHLREMEADLIIERRVRQVVPPEVEYAMSRHGLSLCAVVEQMAAWGGKHRRYLARRPTA